jgi:hypothetical protein
MGTIQKSQLPESVPPVPRGYVLSADEQGKVFASAPADKRKSRGRVPQEPKVFVLMEGQDGRLSWQPQGADYATRELREKMLEMYLKSEILFNIKATNKAPKCSTILRQEYGMSGTPVSLYMQWCRFKGYTPDRRVAEMALREGELA